MHKLGSASVALAVAAVLVFGGNASARPPYKGFFETEFAKDKVEVSCLTCHGAKADDATKPDPKNRNAFGKAMIEAMDGKKNISPKTDDGAALLKKVLETALSKEASNGKTYQANLDAKTWVSAP